ncbi:hypothetical protein [Cellulosimicrobium sp. CpK407]|uniref:hypothetical protein n=1 Tax=Cellulosimicrobium sp. CpK407 TaxID=3229847 RepID=UPI003F3559CA
MDELDDTPDEITPGTVPDEDRITWIVTCRTPGCENADQPVHVLAPEHEPHVVCGPCGNEITNLIHL